MKVEVKRIGQGKESTLSKIYVDDSFICYGLEDAVRPQKIKSKTAIPTGTYQLGLNRYGGMNAGYKRRFPAIHDGMIEIQDIPNYSYVYIHIGNNIGDTSGCLLVGDSYHKDDDGDYVLEKSTKAYKRLYQLLVKSMLQEEVCLVVK